MPDLLSDNPDVMASLLRALCDPGQITPRAPLESLPSWQRRAVIEHAAPFIAAAERRRLAAVMGPDRFRALAAEWEREAVRAGSLAEQREAPAAIMLSARAQAHQDCAKALREALADVLGGDGPAELVAEGAGPLLDPDCRDGKCGSCVGAPCEHSCHQKGASHG